MSETDAKPAAYRRLDKHERQLSESPFLDSMAAVRRSLPMGMGRFDRLLTRAIAEASERGCGFYLGGFAARRALGSELMIDVDPAVLTHRLIHRFKHGERACSVRDKFLGAGDWTPLLRALKRSSTHREVGEIVQANFHYRQTPSYAKALERVSSAEPIMRNFVALSSPAKVEAYFHQTAEMCRSIHEFGILARRDYGWRLASFARPSVRLPWIEFGEVDIGVAIGAAGKLYRFASGKHRTAAAQALGLKSMPVEVRLVHADWLARHMADTGLPPAEALRRGIETLKLAGAQAS